MHDDVWNGRGPIATSAPPLPEITDRATWQAQLDDLLVREKAHTREGDAIATARRRLPMVEVDSSIPVIGERGQVPLLEVFEGRRQLIAYYHMWHTGQPAQGQCPGCTFCNGQVSDISYLHSRDVTFATISEGPYQESARYREFMGYAAPWYSSGSSDDALLGGRGSGTLICYLRDGDRVFETYWTTGRATEAMGSVYGLLDMTVYGRQETCEDSPAGWPQFWQNTAEQWRINGRPTLQWPRLAAGHSDDLGTTSTAADTVQA
jgi:predicted dithiol-disulfide oxidoreductase (DUF899 family)